MKYFEIHSLFKGKKAIKVIKAPNKTDAISMAKSKTSGVILNVKETSAPVEDQLENLKNNIMNAITKKSIQMKDLIAAVRQLAVMTDAGISIHDSIKEVSKATVDKTLKEIFEQVDDDLNSGLSLTESMMSFRHELGDVTIAMVELGESTGNMAESLEKLAEILEEIEENRQKFKNFLLIGIIATIVTFKYLLKNNEDFKAQYDRYILKVYLIGNITFYATLSRFTLVFTELIRAGIPISDALDTALLTLDNVHLKKQLAAVKTSVSRGISLTESFKDTGLFEGMLIQMIHAGEQSGTLDKMLDKVTLYFKSKFNEIIDNIAAYIEPILLAFIAGMVLLMALGIFMPMWDMAQAVKN